MRTSKAAELGGALVGGLVAAVAFSATVFGVGRLADFEALRLIEAALPTARFLASSALAAGATVLALLLTLLGLSLTSDYEFSDRLYNRARYITVLSVVAIVLGTAVLLAVTVPLEEVEALRAFYDVLYFLLAGSLAMLGGVMVTIGLMIAATLIGLIQVGHPEGVSHLLADEDMGVEEVDEAKDS